MMDFEHIGELAALLTAFCWTVTAMAFESAGKRVGSLSVNFIRLIMAIVFLGILGWFTRGQVLPLDADAHAWLWLGISGIVGFTIGDLFLFRAFVVIGSRISVLLMSIVPPFTALIGWFVLGEMLTSIEWLGMALTVSGVAWVVMERVPDAQNIKSRLPVSGIMLGIGGALGQALGLVLSKYGMREYDPFAATQIRVIIGAAGFGVLFCFIRWWPKVFTAIRDRQAMKRISLGAFFGPFLGVSLSLVAVKYTEAGVAATITAILPVLIIPPTILIKKERVSPRAVAGAVVAICGTALMFV